MLDSVIKRARENHWSNLDEILDEYNIFKEEEKKDQADATVNGVDLSSSKSLFRSIWMWI